MSPATQNQLFGPDRDIRTVLLDPPWDAESGGGRIKRGADRHYPLMKPRRIARVIQQKCAPWQRLADTAHVWIWTTNTTVVNGDALRLAQLLGVRPITQFTWVKRTQDGNIARGLGQYSYGSTEHLWLCRRGDTMKPEPGHRHRTAFDAPVGEHSRKPEKSYRIIEDTSPGPYLELFARRSRPGWEVWGNEV